ncbi:rubrerythrin-like domain-containing protein [Halomarina halobia]|uniref:Rubrerythrin-like domain-containing protein n=1 Tax=Halomarina halobia TaxID=3033386 RepID=A0ABD6ACE5_9EURY|nr:rubrerythrin-like domain-containing protein [Halomarina sp. PSR21]
MGVEDPYDGEPPYTFECTECGERVEADTRPGPCSNCGGRMRNISRSREK